MKKLFSLCNILLLLCISGCIDLEQVTKLKPDGSGSIDLHYRTKSSNLSMGDELGGLSFNEDQIRKRFSSSNTNIKSVVVENVEADTTTHVKINIEFNDFNYLSEAQGFSGIKSQWIKGNGVMEFSYIIEKDSVNVSGMNENFLEYKFEFSDEVIATNGVKEFNTVSWKIPVSRLTDKIEMTATVKSKGKTCGIFGYEFMIFLAVLFAVKIKKRS